MICAPKKITKNLAFSCLLVGGVEAYMYVFNRDEVLGPVRDVTNPQIITDLTMKVKTVGPPAVPFTGFKYEGFNFSVKPTASFVAGKAAGPRYDHIVDFTVFARGAAVKLELEALGFGRKIVVIENVNKNNDNAFDVYGLDVGLELKSLKDDSGADTEGAYAVQLGSPDDFKEPHLPATFFDTDYSTTVATLIALISTDAAIS